MGNSIEAGTNIKYEDETGTHYLFAGDWVICRAGERIYNGMLSWIGKYRVNTESEPQQVISIDMVKSSTSVSREIISINDITEIRRNPFYDKAKPFGNPQDFIGAFIQNGYSREQAKAVCDRMNDATVFYSIPYVKATVYALDAVRQIKTSGKSNDKDIIMELAKQCVEETQKEYFELVAIYQKVIEQCDRDTACLKDTLEIVSKCWNDLEKQKTDETTNV